MSPSEVTDDSELEFFGVKLKVNNPRLAALLNSDVTTEDVQVIGRRAREAFSGADDGRAERDAEQEIAERVLNAADSVTIRVDEGEGV
jgi:hypothetical protein